MFDFMSSYSYIENQNFMANSTPQPFYIEDFEFDSFEIESCGSDNSKFKGNILLKDGRFYQISKSLCNALVSALGFSGKLIQKQIDSVDIWDQLIPIINFMLSKYIKCFVFYAYDGDDEILDLRVNDSKEGPINWDYQLPLESKALTCFHDFDSLFGISESNDIQILSGDIMSSKKTVQFDSFKSLLEGNPIQPIIRFKGKSSAESFNTITGIFLDKESNIPIMLPYNYAKSSHDYDTIWNHDLLSLLSKLDFDSDFSSELNEVVGSNILPQAILGFALDFISSGDNKGRTLREIINCMKTYIESLYVDKKADKFKLKAGALLGSMICLRYRCCEKCRHMSLDVSE